MRIAHVLKHSRNNNGNVHVAVDLACAQADLGHEVFFASGDGHFDDLLRAHGVEVLTLSGGGRLTGQARALALLRRLVRRRGVDVLHAHMMSSALVCAVVARTTRASCVATMHNSFDPHSVLMRVADRVIAVSGAERESLIARGFPARKVVTVLNGANESPRDEVAAAETIRLRRPAVVTLSGLHPRKAVDDVLRAFALLVDDFPDWTLSVVGSGPARDDLVTMARELGIGDRVDFPGASSQPRALLAQADIYVSASLADPCPLSVAEARAAGCAIVATAVGGVPELLDQGSAGRLCPSRDPDALAAVLGEFMGDPAALAFWRERARAGIDHLTVARVAVDNIEVYRTLRSRGRRWPEGTATSEGGHRMKRLSVVVANHNHAAFIAEAIDSALAIRWPDVEVIVVDDGSTDSSREVIDRFRDRVVVHFQDNRGQRCAANEGFALSSGDVVVFLDADDVLPPDLAERIARVWGPHVSKAQFRMQRIDGRGRPFGSPFPQVEPPPTPATVRQWMTSTSAYPTPVGSGNAYARWFLERLFPVPEEVGDFVDSACLAAAPLLGDVITVPDVVVGYRRHGGNDSDLLVDPRRFSREVERARRRWRYAHHVSDGAVDGADVTLRRSRELLQLRVAAHRLSPDGALPGDHRVRLLGDALLAPIRPGPESSRVRALISAWCLAMLVAPAPLVPRLITLRYGMPGRGAAEQPEGPPVRPVR